MIHKAINTYPELSEGWKKLEEKGIFVASEEYHAAAKRLCGKIVFVLFANFRMRPEVIGKAYNMGKGGKMPVIQIRRHLPIVERISTLVHECAHHQEGGLTTLAVVNGKCKIVPSNRPVYHGLIETEIKDTEAEIMARVQARFDVLQQKRGYRWDGKLDIHPGVVNLVPRFEADLLACVY